MSSIAPGSFDPQMSQSENEHRLELLFAPINKTAFGIALGAALAVLIFGITAVNLTRAPTETYPLSLLAQYFYMYTVTWKGALIGAWWGGVAGFAGGWFFAFCRNFVQATYIFLLRTRAEIRQTRDFLDHI